MAALALAWSVSQAGATAPQVMPAWLVAYPGASAETRQLSDGVEASYSTTVTPHEVIEWFRKLFAEKGLKFEPMPTGDGYFARVEASECGLSVSIRAHTGHIAGDELRVTAVKVTCTAKSAANQATTWLPVKDPPAQDTTDVMKTFDKPVYPDRKAAAALKWPSWLVAVDGDRLPVERLPGQLKSSFAAAPPRYAIEVFYADLLDAHGFRVNKSPANSPEVFGSWVEGTADPDAALGRKTVIRVKIKPVGQAFQVEITVQ
jgi:hypothetical protein